MTEPMVLLEFAGTAEDEESLRITRETTHDSLRQHLAERGHRQTGPVEWRTYDPDYAGEALSGAGLADHPDAPGLIEWLQSNAGTVLLIASVPYEPLS